MGGQCLIYREVGKIAQLHTAEQTRHWLAVQ
jgi:hypothetical protein